MLIDLQIHSTYSDGYLTPTQAAAFLAKKKVRVASLTDHNTLRGQLEFKRACAKRKIKVIPGMELYSKLGNKRINLLWFNYQDKPELHEVLRNSQIRRKSSMRKALNKLKEALKIQIDIEKILDQYNHYIPINKIVGDIISNPKNLKIIKKELRLKNPIEEEIIHNLFYNKKLVMMRDNCVSLKSIMKLKEKIGGQIIYNHPAKYGRPKEDLVEKISKTGLEGMEVLSPHHSFSDIVYLQALAEKYEMIMTGGSDFHRDIKSNNIKNSWDYFCIDSKNLKGIEKIIN